MVEIKTLVEKTLFTEGVFSWKAQDTGRIIWAEGNMGNHEVFPVYMIDPRDGTQYQETNYQGYGVFGGKDYYELLAEINGGKTREDGILLAFHPKEGQTILTPILVEDPSNWEKYKGLEPEINNYQGYFGDGVDDYGDPTGNDPFENVDQILYGDDDNNPHSEE